MTENSHAIARVATRTVLPPTGTFVAAALRSSSDRVGVRKSRRVFDRSGIASPMIAALSSLSVTHDRYSSLLVFVKCAGSWAGHFLWHENLNCGCDSALHAVVPALCSTPLFLTRLHSLLRIHSQTIGDAVDVVKVANDLSRYRDLFIGET